MLKRSLYVLIIPLFAGIYSCTEDGVNGCTDSDACNYNSQATVNDGSCTFICLTNAEKARVINFVDGAIAFIDTYGNDSAYAAFEEVNGQFIDDELYIFVWDDSANVLSHGFQPNLIGTNVYDLQDIHGKYFVHELIDIGNSSEGKGWGWYYWDDPITNTIRKKFTYIARHGNIMVASGTYK